MGPIARLSPSQLPLMLPIVGLAVVALGRAGALENGLARTPPMGWLSWERFTCELDCASYPADCISSRLYREMADRLSEDGYAALGYNYVNIDDCWSELERDASTGNLVANATRFPEGGIQALADYVHARGLKLGIYGDCGTKTCAGYPAQLKSELDLEDNYFVRDAKLLADWRVDSFKFDGCHLDPAKAESVCPRMAQAIEASGRPMLIVCEWPFYMLQQKYQLVNARALEPNLSLAESACNAWRYYEDVEDSWLSVLSIVDFTIRLQQTIYKYHGPGHWFDPDQLVVGNFALSLDQARAQMALWCVWSAPLYMSNDLRRIEPQMAAVLKNRLLIEVNQDPMGVFGLMVAESNSSSFQAFVKPVLPIRNGCPSFAIVYLNRRTLGGPSYVTFNTRDLLTRVPIALAAERMAALANTHGTYGSSATFDAQHCKQLLQVAMTRRPEGVRLLNRPPDAEIYQPEPLEVKRVDFQLVDLFGDDERPLARTTLDGKLTLKVNLSGVRAVKLIML